MVGQKVSGMRGLALALLAVLLGVVPGTFAAKATDEGQILKVALAIPRSQEIEIEVKKYNDKLAALTNNSVKVRIYWGGAAGDDLDVLRKMKTGQMDATAISLELCSQFARQALVMASPALFTNYKQLDAVRAALTPSFDEEAYQNGMKVMGWGDVGRLRLMSKQPVSTLADFRKMRPWLYPQSEMLKDFYKQVNATGVPLGLIEVYGALQTNMIDVVWISSLMGAALQWHTGTHYISEQGLGFISGAFIIRRGAWDALPQNVKDSMLKMASEMREKNQIEARKADERAYKKLIERGHKPVKIDKLPEWQKIGETVREHMVGRIYTRDLLNKAESIAKQYAD
jgi:TRAP-type C4-dicarboxylate transport system substrate-binding protein